MSCVPDHAVVLRCSSAAHTVIFEAAAEPLRFKINRFLCDANVANASWRAYNNKSELNSR